MEYHGRVFWSTFHRGPSRRVQARSAPSAQRLATIYLAASVAGCGQDSLLLPAPAVLFTTPITVNGQPAGDAIVDTGGGYDLMLRERHGLEVVDTLDILIFDGISSAGVTEPFTYAAGGFEAPATVALVGVDLCDCNGIGYFFMRRTGAVLNLDFERASASFDTVLPRDGVSIPFATPPAQMEAFDTSFIQVELADAGGDSVVVTALVDTGAGATVMRRGLLGTTSGMPGAPRGDRADILIIRHELGTVSANVGLFDTPGLPDLLIGVDVMRAWSNNWSFQYDGEGGTIHVVPRTGFGSPEIDGGNLTSLARPRHHTRNP